MCFDETPLIRRILLGIAGFALTQAFIALLSHPGFSHPYLSQSGQSDSRWIQFQSAWGQDLESSEGIDESRQSGGSLLEIEGAELIVALETALTEVIERSERSVVAITRVRKDQAARSQFEGLRLAPALQWQDDPTSEDFIPTFFGTGIVISPEGFIVTCAHVLDDPRRNDYYVWLDRRCYPAEAVGMTAEVQAADPFSDLAVLRVDAGDLVALPIADQPVRKGQVVVSLGNPYSIARDGRASASWGIVANIERFAPREKDRAPAENIHQLGTLIHTDLRQPIGSSGGALINARGELVGMMTNLLPARGYENPAGFAIAADGLFQRVVESLKLGKQPEYGFLGVQPDNLLSRDLDRGIFGARISLVIPGLPGSQAGLREGDVIFQVEDASIGNRNDLFRELSRQPVGRKVRLKVYRAKRAAQPQIVNLEAELGKKFIATSRPAYSLHGPPTWRGIQVEYQSAIAGELERIAIIRGGPKVALLNVAPDSPAWRAGLRAGFGLVSVNGRAIQTPEQFHQLTSSITGDVTLQVVASSGRPLTAVIPADQRD